jgi:hypothetical protein
MPLIEYWDHKGVQSQLIISEETDSAFMEEMRANLENGGSWCINESPPGEDSHQWICCRKLGHQGSHVAMGVDRVYAIWNCNP